MGRRVDGSNRACPHTVACHCEEQSPGAPGQQSPNLRTRKALPGTDLPDGHGFETAQNARDAEEPSARFGRRDTRDAKEPRNMRRTRRFDNSSQSSLVNQRTAKSLPLKTQDSKRRTVLPLLLCRQPGRTIRCWLLRPPYPVRRRTSRVRRWPTGDVELFTGCHMETKLENSHSLSGISFGSRNM